MNMGYFDKEKNAEGDNPPGGIILAKEKDELLAEYATYRMNSRLFASKYQLYLPNKEELRRLLNNQLADANTTKIDNRKKRQIKNQERKKNNEKHLRFLEFVRHVSQIQDLQTVGLL